MNHISGQPCSALPDTKAVELSQLKLGAFSFMLVFLFKESFELFLTTFSNKSLTYDLIRCAWVRCDVMDLY